MTEIYLIRHTQAEGNQFRMMQGQWDGGVTPLGFRQIEALKERFAHIPIDAVYSSDLTRTRLTASAVTVPHHLPLHTLKALREINLGPWETLFFANIIHDEPEQMQRFIRDPEHWHLDGAESYQEVTERAYPALEEIARRHDGQTVVVVSHGVTIRCLLSKITGVRLNETDRLPIARNTAVSKLLWDGECFTAVYINDSSHLDGMNLPSWSSTADLRHEVFDPATDRAYYERCYEDAWIAAHGSTAGFASGLYYSAALEHHRDHPGAVLKIYNKDEAVGLVDLDTRRGAHALYGWISLLYLKPDSRRKGYGAQLLGRAVQVYRELGRRSIRLHVARDNSAALAFYQHHGFTLLGEDKSSGAELLLMEKNLGGTEHA